MLTIAMTLAGLGLADFFFGRYWYDAEFKELNQQLTIMTRARNNLQKRGSELQERYEQLEKEHRALNADFSTATEHAQAIEADRIKIQSVLTKEQASRQALQKKFKALQSRMSELQDKLKADEQNQKSESISSGLPKVYTNSIDMEFVRIPKGTFEMGSKHGDSDKQPVYRVTISQPFYLGKYEVTQAQWKKVMGHKNNPSELKGDTLPVTHISWHEAQAFIKKLNAKEQVSAYRLPTEAEWEYASRAATTTAYSFGDDAGSLDQYGWYAKNSGNSLHPVGQLKANPWGLYDMHGNVWEWVQDWYSKTYPSGHQADPKGPEEGRYRVIRGGSFGDSPGVLRSAFRDWYQPEHGDASLGFRCVRIPPLP